jgi:RNA-directed DNA polymerase
MSANRRKRGKCKSETFHFLGFTHICGRKRWNGGFIVKRKTIAKRLRTRLQEVKQTLRMQRYLPISEQGRWAAWVARGYL